MINSHPHPRNNPYNLLSCHWVNNPCQHQPGHSNEQSPEHFFDLFILPKRINDRIRISLHRTLNQLRHEDKERKKQDRSPNECQGDLGLSRKSDAGSG